jgi:acyl-CoA synthetase (AMP-forming)/AMP-acid ligase II
MGDVPPEVAAGWRERGLWGEDTMGESFAAVAASFPEARLIASDARGETTMTLGEVFVRASRLAGGFAAMRLRPGSILAVQMPARHEALITHAAAALAGLAVLPIIHIYGAHELDFILAQSGAQAVVVPDRWRGVDYVDRVRQAPAGRRLPLIVAGEGGVDTIDWHALAASAPLDAPIKVSPDSLAYLVYTSGTASRPKGVMHSHRSWMAELRTTFVPADRQGLHFSPWPPGHVAGLLGFCRFWVLGLPMVILDHWDGREAARLVATHRVTATQGTPFHLTTMLDAADADGRDLSSLVDYQAGATPVPPAVTDRCARFGLRIYRAYGMTEHPTVSRGSPDDPLEKRLTDGAPCPGVEIRIVDDTGQDTPIGTDGEILARGPERFAGYLDAAANEGVILADGWLRTGDVGRLDAEGCLRITDRKKDIIIRGGENISSREVEELVAGMTQVAEVAAVGAPDARLGERVCVFVVLRPGATLSIDEIAACFAARGVARPKTPELLRIVEALPRNAAGKVVKQDLRAALAASRDEVAA